MAAVNVHFILTSRLIFLLTEIGALPVLRICVSVCRDLVIGTRLTAVATESLQREGGINLSDKNHWAPHSTKEYRAHRPCPDLRLPLYVVEIHWIENCIDNRKFYRWSKSTKMASTPIVTQPLFNKQSPKWRWIVFDIPRLRNQSNRTKSTIWLLILTHFIPSKCRWTGGQRTAVAFSRGIAFIPAWRFPFGPPVHRLWRYKVSCDRTFECCGAAYLCKANEKELFVCESHSWQPAFGFVVFYPGLISLETESEASVSRLVKRINEVIRNSSLFLGGPTRSHFVGVSHFGQHRENTLFLPCGHLDFQSAVTARNDEFKGSLIARIHALAKT